QAPVRAVIGSRFAPGGTTPSFSARRRWASLGGNWLLYRGLGGGAGLPRLADYTSGFRCLEAQALRECLPACRGEGAGGRGYAFQSSLIAAFMLAGREVAEIPIAFGQWLMQAGTRTRVDWTAVMSSRFFLSFSAKNAWLSMTRSAGSGSASAMGGGGGAEAAGSMRGGGWAAISARRKAWSRAWLHCIQWSLAAGGR